MYARFLAALALTLLVVSPLAGEESRSEVHVSGEGLVRVAPDRVVIDLSVTTNDDDLVRVRESSDKDARAILALAKKNGVKETGFEVTRMDFSFTYNDQLRRRIYKVERELTIQLDDLSKLEPLLTDLLKEENLKVGDISFVSSNTKKHEIEARRLAVADARARAEHLAELNGLSVDKAIDIRMVHEYAEAFVTSCSPVVGSTVPRIPRDNDFPAFQLTPKTPGGTKIQFVSFQTEKEKPEGNQFGLGKISITAKVSITFEIKK